MQMYDFPFFRVQKNAIGCTIFTASPLQYEHANYVPLQRTRREHTS